ncbi:hypothetical protein INP82_24235, partial [Citrobacter sedlakii]|nr:hypothetical protein [Citrobacter sedlakii]
PVAVPAVPCHFRGFIQVNIFLPAETPALPPAFPHPFSDAAARRVIQVAAFQQYSALLLNAIIRQPVPGIVMIVVAVAAAVVDFTLMSYSFMTFPISFYFT